ncbi:hypothetical protein LX15_002681 [Streptoalloteichus tenebrarius]|uniref:DUF5671 domain-containing protein n=1 Tax=Streptoalloteichus tenebrarius (strain ATCC 17920 / DSM 40477 / JCM 4838 / CBS 697.72 / NBRC 16177 / NCIMB 11028 / NRRL B-12390 / A12253. 1 / ISP 5477) TaxID=1933 RepID=A0ABT1HU06_STRSD|nr:hypothetical protein [Streptoalloteichus tenebrarius]MCP2258982.1 hypothetical protein [Streptoalloteichus tenebrarius]
MRPRRLAPRPGRGAGVDRGAGAGRSGGVGRGAGVDTGAGGDTGGGGAPNTDWSELARLAGGVLANATVLSALLVYFGWQRADAESRALGVDESLRGLSNQYYLLSSVGPLFPVLSALALLALGWLWVDGRLRARFGGDGPGPRARRVLGVLALAWLVLPAVVLAARLVVPLLARLLFPASIGLGALLSLYALSLRRLAGQAGAQPGVRLGGQLGGGSWRWRSAKWLVASVVALSLFWSASRYAEVYGQWQVDGLERDLAKRPAVVVYATERLHLDTSIAEETRLDPENAHYRFRYRGLRLVEHTGNRFFLIPDGWTRGRGVVVVLPDDSNTRMEFVRGG